MINNQTQSSNKEPVEIDSLDIFFKIPKEKKLDLRRELHALGIHEGFIYPELERQAAYITRKYLPEYLNDSDLAGRS